MSEKEITYSKDSKLVEINNKLLNFTLIKK